MRIRRKRGSALVESAMIWPLILLITAAVVSHGLEELELVREEKTACEAERSARGFDMPVLALSWSSLPVFSEALSSDVWD